MAESISKVYVFVEDTLKKLRRLRKDFEVVFDTLTHYCLQDPDLCECAVLWQVLGSFEKLSNLAPKEREKVSELLAKVNAKEIERRGKYEDSNEL